MDDTYLTISRISEGIYKEKMSKFLAFAIPVSSVEDVKKQLEKYQKEYYDALESEERAFLHSYRRLSPFSKGRLIEFAISLYLKETGKKF